MSKIYSLIIGLFMSLSSAALVAETDVCAPFKDGGVDDAIVSRMLAAADDGHLYRIDPASSKVGFCVESPVGLIEGEFKDFTGGLTFLQEAVSDEQALVKVRTDSLETGGKFIERMLRGKSFFDVKNYPEILFVSTAFQWVSATEAVLLGKLTMHGVTRDVGFHVVLVQEPAQDGEHQHVRVRATTLIRRSEFGLSALYPMVSDSVNLCMSVDAVKYVS